MDPAEPRPFSTHGVTVEAGTAVKRFRSPAAGDARHFYGGEPLELLEYDPVAHQPARHELHGATPVAVIPTGVWQAARSLGAYSLVGCTDRGGLSRPAWSRAGAA